MTEINNNTNTQTNGTNELPELTCAIVRDLLPLYHDRVVSSETADAVKAHIDKCPPCALELIKLGEEIPLTEDTHDTVKSFRKMVKKKRRKSFLVSFLCFLAGAFAIIIGAFCFFGATKYILRDAMIIPYDAGVADVISVHHAAFPNCKFKDFHRDLVADDQLFIMLYAPPGDMEVTRENGVVELTFKHPIWNPELYAMGLNAKEFTIPVQEGDRFLSINGMTVCEIGEAKTGDDIPGYVRAFHWAEGSMQGCSWETHSPETPDEKFTIKFSPIDDDGSITWDTDGNVIEDTTHNKDYLDIE
ncbi:MAG: zf-HC2 domain-containing protein [Ruminococcus sp.]|nr:zf-HC2 domain-containing protein [Ruminococcus sp.]